MESIEIKSLETKNNYFITIARQGENNMACPECSKNRKSGNEKKKCFSFNFDKGVGHCQNCGADFVKNIKMLEKEKTYSIPDKKNFTKLKDEHLQYLSKRGFIQETVNAFKLVSENNLIVIIFGYLYSDDNMFVDGFAPYESVSVNGWYAPVMFKQKMKFFWKQILFGDMFDHLLIK